jgi:hypothetical protein
VRSKLKERKGENSVLFRTECCPSSSGVLNVKVDVLGSVV